MSQIETETPTHPPTLPTQNIDNKTLIYSKDFLIQFQTNFKVDTTIVEMMKQFVASPQENRKVATKIDATTPKQRIQFNESAGLPRTPNGKFAKNIGVSRTPKPVKSVAPVSTKKTAPLTTLKPLRVKPENVNAIAPSAKTEVPRRPLGLIATNIANNQGQASPKVSAPEWSTKKIESTKKAMAQPALNQIYYQKQHAQPSTPTVFLPNFPLSPPIIEAASPMHSPFKPSPPKNESTAPQIQLLAPSSTLSITTPQRRTMQATTPNVKSPNTLSIASATPKRKLPSPLDNHRVSQRQKQIDYGYKTVGYLRYRLLVPKEHRAPDHPRTPRKEQGCSKRSWDGQLKKWRRELHRWDPEDIAAFQSLLESDVVKGIISRSADLASIIDEIKKKMIEGNFDMDDDMGDWQDESPADKENPTNTSTQKKEISIQGSATINPTVSVAPPANIKDLVADITNFENVARTLVF